MSIAKQLKPEIHSKQVSVAAISGEKETTVRNWLFTNKVPPKGKRLRIADKFGVDVNYLFEDGPYSLPITQFEKSLNCYLVPILTLPQLIHLASSNPLPISGRTIISLSSELIQNLTQVEKTYCIVASGIDYEPFISANDTLFVNVAANKIIGNFCILVGENTRIIRLKNDGHWVNSRGDPVELTETAVLLPIIITMSSNYVKHAQ